MRDIPLGGGVSALAWDQLALPVEGGMGVLEDLACKLERDVIERAIRLYPNKSNTELAEILGTSRRVFESRLKHYNILKS